MLYASGAKKRKIVFENNIAQKKERKKSGDMTEEQVFNSSEREQKKGNAQKNLGKMWAYSTLMLFLFLYMTIILIVSGSSC